MLVDDLIVFGQSFCHSAHVKLLLSDILGLNPLELLNHLNDYVPVDKVNRFKREIVSLSEGKPLQYVIGHVNFYGNEFNVNEKVLIPRFETEELVENTIRYAKEIFDADNKPIRILDIGCGSGVIGITLKKYFPNATIDLVDISPDAIKVAKENAEKLNIDVNFIESDLFDKVNSKYDIIVSNPPYIMDDEEIEEIVKNNEPHLALYGGKDGLDIYRRVLVDIKNYMNDKCLIAFEIGMRQKKSIIDLANEYLKDIVIEAKQDMSNKDRMLFILKR